ncbi:MAG: hypothetical protein FJW90_03590 [Actinobacteria bacterium]|nr:hypothetical protein [Actinomycetota bacterium]
MQICAYTQNISDTLAADQHVRQVATTASGKKCRKPDKARRARKCPSAAAPDPPQLTLGGLEVVERLLPVRGGEGDEIDSAGR